MSTKDQGTRLLDKILTGVDPAHPCLTHTEHVPPRRARHAPWPDFVPTTVRDAFRSTGMIDPWQHQAEAATLAASGEHVIVSTGTASGKSACYQLPVLTALHEDPRATAIYLAPTKALGADQLRSVRALGLTHVRAATLDGDTPTDERDWVRDHANWIFSNPDMLHFSLLPRHDRWARVLRRLRYVVIDECHSYRGVFGSHVALLLRRLRRVAALYGADPVFVLASATVSDPGESAARLTGVTVREVIEDHSPRGARTVALWEPGLVDSLPGENGAPTRRSAGAESARILAELTMAHARTLVFLRSRAGAELTAMGARHALTDKAPELADKIAAYRGGYLAEDRRGIEADLDDGTLLGVATTNALELGVDIAGLDAVVVAGYPGTLASFWQQAGRAGRAESTDALVVFVARDDPLDTYLVHHPDAVFSRPVEATVLDPANPYVLQPHLACAAAEAPLTEDSIAEFGGEIARDVLTELTESKVLRRRPRGWFWVGSERPHHLVDLRGSGGGQVVVVEAESGRLLGTVDSASAAHSVHPGAVHLHQGASFVVDSLDLDNGIAMVHKENPEWFTTAREVVDIRVLQQLEQRDHGRGVRTCLGMVEVTSQVVGYLRKLPSGRILDQVPLDLPEQSLTTKAVWYTMGENLLQHNAPGCAGLEPARVPGALHAAEHAAIGLLPLFATCDRWDIGGVSTALHADTGEATVFVHDGHPGGAGFADRGFAALIPWLATTRKAIASCECSAGCPSCVQSPKCGNGNEPLDKLGAVAVLDAVVPVIAATSSVSG